MKTTKTTDEDPRSRTSRGPERYEDPQNRDRPLWTPLDPHGPLWTALDPSDVEKQQEARGGGNAGL
ncbi:hypothetical protein EYF80_058978 [Liparis tanakae]|uniref:Uncharacterized protein n=1 Tax=Liparis tanakae TaxID=230148 RepID=A0A4Z2EPX2_9TELE|nr:hypothetical protein EYF80_058978 [Liparis tanakae]